MEYKILSGINSPDDVKKLNKAEIGMLCSEVREIITETVSKNGGHLASNLGAVELTVALHRAFSSPKDAIIFDVGHQCYTHKLLTGRFKQFDTIRTENGISGYMRPAESEHDYFVTGHSSNSISAAYGIYKAKCLTGAEGTAVAVIGDGAMTGGMAYEALNNVGGKKGNFVIVINDNEMSISKNVGSVAHSFSKLRNRPFYHNAKDAIGEVLLKIPFCGKSVYEFLYRIKEKIKRSVYKGNVFTSLGFNYLGPVDGHDVETMEWLFKVAQEYRRPTVIHIVTVKGKGYTYAESNPNSYHGVSPFDRAKGISCGDKPTFSEVAGAALCELAENNPKICAVTAAMGIGTGLDEFSNKYKDRFFDVGIAEQHAVTFSAGLARGGAIPFFAVYSSFLQRGYDQVLHDAAIAGLPLKLLIDRAGFVGEDGETHQGLFDVAFLSTIPGISIYSPYCYSELIKRIKECAQNNELCAIRYPRGCEKANFNGDLSGDFTVIGNGGKNVIITYGRLFSESVEAVADLADTDIIKLNKIFPISNELIEKISQYKNVHFFEEGIRSGGVGEHIGNRLAEIGFSGRYTLHAVEGFVPAATVSKTIKKYGLDSASMRKILKEDNV